MATGVGGAINPGVPVKPLDGSAFVTSGGFGQWSTQLILQSNVGTKPTGLAGIILSNNGATGDFTTTICPITGQTQNNTWQTPNRSDTFAGLGAQTFTGAQSFSSGITSTGSSAFVLGGLFQTASSSSGASNFPILQLLNTDTAEGNGCGIRFTGTATNSATVSGANILCSFTSKGSSVLNGTLFFNTANAGVDGTRLQISANGDSSFSSTTDATSTTTGALVVSGGIAWGTTKTAFGGLLNLTGTTDSTTVSTGTIIVSGGIGVAKRLTLDGSTGKTIKYVNPTANAAVATTLGSVGPTGSTAGNPQGWMRVDINGTDRYVPFW